MTRDDPPAAALPAGNDRFLTLDVIRGVAVIGILVANLPAFALPRAAYFSPLAWGGTSPADIAAWFVTFVFVEGKMRGLFSFLFGASILLVIDRADDRANDRRGGQGSELHLLRMATLFLLGSIHLYLIWWGDILAHYALVGAIALPFARLPARPLMVAGLFMLAWTILLGVYEASMLFASAARNTPQAVAIWNAYANSFGIPPTTTLTADIAGQGGGWWAGVIWRWHHADGLLLVLLSVGPQTLGAMLLGMAGYRSGFLTGEWSRARYRRWTVACLGMALPAYAAMGFATIAHGFDQRWVMLASIVASQPFRVLGFVGYAALIILLIHPGGRLTSRLAATGRTAFTNYIGTSIVMTGIFGWGLGQFGLWSRASLYALMIPACAVMLWWPTAWLARYLYGPLEWVWRSMARLERPPLRRR